MNCTRLRSVLDAHLDDEVDRATGDEAAQHLGACPACAQLRDERTALRQVIRSEAPYFTAPAALADTVRRSLSRPVAARGDRKMSWLHAAAVAVIAAACGLTAGYRLGPPARAPVLPEQVAASHVASLAEPTRLVAVASSDRHAVKPWFQGKVDFAPPVKDLAAEGMDLLGGRLDRVGSRPAAAIVYRIRNHVINLYVWRTGPEAEATAESRTRGYTVETWAEDGLRYAAISDVDPRDLQRFASLVRGR